MAEVVKQRATDIPLPHFPDDVLIEIFLRLPVISLLLFRSVSKHWLRLIQNPHFITLHINRPINNYNDHNPILIARAVSLDQSKKPNIVLTLLSDDDTQPYQNDVALEVLSSTSTPERIYHLLGPCSGLFCVTVAFGIVIFNPTTKRCRKVPRSPISFESRGCHDDISFFDYVGFGFDPVSKDYKVVMFDSTVQQMSDGDSSEVDGVRFKVGIFSLSTNCWRELKCVKPAGNMCVIHNGSNLYFNSAIHWRGGNLKVFCNYESILVFDLSKEAFKRFELPNNYIEEEVYLTVLTESLGIIVHKDKKIRRSNCVFELWVMQEYGVNKSWKKLYDINIDVEIDWPLWFSNGEFLLQNKDRKLVSYNQITKTINEFQFHGDFKLMYAFRYKESLVSFR